MLIKFFAISMMLGVQIFGWTSTAEAASDTLKSAAFRYCEKQDYDDPALKACMIGFIAGRQTAQTIDRESTLRRQRLPSGSSFKVIDPFTSFSVAPQAPENFSQPGSTR